VAAPPRGGNPIADFVLLGDQPHDDSGDPLGFDAVTEELAALILSSRDSTPFTLGIEAAWGMGKSTLMGRLCKRLEQEQEYAVKPVLFNAWTADGGGVLEGLVKTVLSELDPNILRRTLRNQKLMSWLRVGLSIAGSFVGLTSLVDSIWRQTAVDPRLRNDLPKLVQEGVAAWREKQPGLAADNMLCVFIDDLDRCSPRGVLEVFEAMKLYLDAPGIVFVVGYDQDIISDLVLREKGYAETIRSRDYLEKFIQIVYRIPRPAPDRSRELVESLLNASGTSALFGATERELVIDGSQSNPRRLKRFVNGFVLAYGLDPRWRQFEPQALVRMQLLQMYFPEFARMLEQPAERDPIEEFVEFRAARAALLQEDRKDEQLKAALQSHGLATMNLENDDFGATLGRLEDNVPVEFVDLANRGEFVSLVESIAAEDEWPRLRQALAEGELPLVPSEGAEFDGKTSSRGRNDRFEGLRILWADDEMERNEGLVEELIDGGAVVVPVENAVAMVHALEGRRFDALVSDIQRSDHPEGGLEAIEDLIRRRRRSDLPPLFPHMPPVIFFTPRITSHWIDRADDVGAILTTRREGLFDLLERIGLQRDSESLPDENRLNDGR
jgi:CheY-like chemotaxis protein